MYGLIECMAKSVDPEHIAPPGAVWSGSTRLLQAGCSILFEKYVNIIFLSQKFK